MKYDLQYSYVTRMPLLIYIIFMVGFMLLVVPEVEPFSPAGRSGHSSVLVGDKIYFFGGELDENRNSDEIFYLDVSESFEMESPPWVQLTGIPFGSSWARSEERRVGKECRCRWWTYH